MSSSVWRYLDIEAEHADNDGESENDENEDWESFFGDNEDLGPEDQHPSDVAGRELAAAAEDAEALERLARSFRPEPRNARIVPDTLIPFQELPLQLRAPHIGDPGLWCVQVKFGHEREAVSQLARKCLSATTSRPPGIVSVFNRDGIGGHIFIEAPSLPDVTRALEGMAFARHAHSFLPRPIEIDRRIELLTSPAPRRLDQAKGGVWVRFTHGLHRGDTGFVYEEHHELDDRVKVLVVPRPPLSTRSRSWNDEAGYGFPEAKRRRLGRPPARPLTVSDAVAIFGQRNVRVWDMTSDTFFLGETLFCASVAMYWVPRCDLEVTDEMPPDLGPFARASAARGWTSLGKWLMKAAQDTIREGMRVIVVRGSLKGLVGHVMSILNGMVSICDSLAAGGARSYDQIELTEILPHFMPGDNIKARWSSSRGIVIMVSYDSDPDELVYVDQNHREISIRTYEAEAHSELRNANLRPGVWVNYVGVTESEDMPMKGYGRILTKDGEIVRVEDDRETHEVVWCNVADLEVAARQREVPLPFAQPLPLREYALPPPLIPELLHKEVIVRDGPLKGRTGTIRNHTVYGATVLMQTDLAFNAMNTKWFNWGLLLVRPSIGPYAPRMLPPSPPRGRTATPEPDREEREATPPLTRWHVSVYKRAEDHWIHGRPIQEIMATKRLAMAVRERGGTLGKSAKTVPLPRRTLEPGAGEVIVSTVQGRRLPRQVSMDPRELIQRPAAVKDDVLVIDGRWLGWVGKVTKVANVGDPPLRLCTVEFNATLPDPQKTHDLFVMDLVIIEN
ncbi:hypothetical protein BC834DRAFT_887875 [Gloeopeniophorella convolvens]|nr:hypothetical protein BC834DRAFT_887875 [Gloeopeniophorella convolvens]